MQSPTSCISYSLSHIGWLLSTAHFAGIVREKVGDVLIQGESGAQILVDPELMEHFLTSLTQVRGQSQHHTLIQTFHLPQTRFLLVVRNLAS